MALCPAALHMGHKSLELQLQLLNVTEIFSSVP